MVLFTTSAFVGAVLFTTSAFKVSLAAPGVETSIATMVGFTGSAFVGVVLFTTSASCTLDLSLAGSVLMVIVSADEAAAGFAAASFSAGMGATTIVVACGSALFSAGAAFS